MLAPSRVTARALADGGAMERTTLATIAITLLLSPLMGQADATSDAVSRPAQAIPVLTAAEPNTVHESLTEASISTPAEDEPISKPSTTVTGGTPEAREIVLDALRAYESLALALPSVEIRIHDERAGCMGYSGLYSSNGTLHWIDICHVSEWVVLHELGHASEAVSTSPAIRSAFMLHEQVDAWADEDVHWGQRGTERAANVIAQVVRTGECGDVSASFELLTGASCPAGGDQD